MGNPSRLSPRRLGSSGSRRCCGWRRGRRRHARSPPQTFTAKGARRGRVALLAGCVNDLLKPEINAATIGVLTRHGIEVVLPDGAGCCGSLVHHMGREAAALAQARANIEAWSAIGGLDAILVNASGCGTTVKDYGFMLRGDPDYAARAARVSGLTKDISEYLAGLPLQSDGKAPPLAVAYHSACSLQHGQRIDAAAEGVADQTRLRREGRSGRSPVLRLGRDLQYFAA